MQSLPEAEPLESRWRAVGPRATEGVNGLTMPYSYPTDG